MSLIIEHGTQYLSDNDLNEIAKYLLNINKNNIFNYSLN